MARLLTSRQQEVYEFIEQRISQRGYGPTVREIGEFLHIKSPNGVMCHLKALERKGMISRTRNKSRSIELVDRQTREDAVGLPVHGQVVRGHCQLFKAPKSVDVINMLQRPERYLLQYAGDDLRDYAIADGDILIVEHASSATLGALTLVKNSQGVIKMRAHTESQSVYLAIKGPGIASLHSPGEREAPDQTSSGPGQVETHWRASSQAIRSGDASADQMRGSQGADSQVTDSQVADGQVADSEGLGSQVIGVVVGVVRPHQPSLPPHRPHRPHFSVHSAVS